MEGGKVRHASDDQGIKGPNVILSEVISKKGSAESDSVLVVHAGQASVLNDIKVADDVLGEGRLAAPHAFIEANIFV